MAASNKRSTSPQELSSSLETSGKHTDKKAKPDVEEELLKEINFSIGFVHGHDFVVTSSIASLLVQNGPQEYRTDFIYHVLTNTQTVDNMDPVVELVQCLLDHGVAVTDNAYNWIRSSTGLTNSLAGSYCRGSWSDRKHAASLYCVSDAYSRIQRSMEISLYLNKLHKELCSVLNMTSPLCRIIHEYSKPVSGPF